MVHLITPLTGESVRAGRGGDNGIDRSPRRSRHAIGDIPDFAGYDAGIPARESAP